MKNNLHNNRTHVDMFQSLVLTKKMSKYSHLRLWTNSLLIFCRLPNGLINPAFWQLLPIFCHMTDNMWNLGLPVSCNNLLCPLCVSLSHKSNEDLHSSLDPLPSAHLRGWHPQVNWAIMKAGGVSRQLVDPHIRDLASDPMVLITWTSSMCGPQFNPDWSIPFKAS